MIETGMLNFVFADCTGNDISDFDPRISAYFTNLVYLKGQVYAALFWFNMPTNKKDGFHIHTSHVSDKYNGSV